MEDLLKSDATATQAHITRELQDRTRKDDMRRQHECLLGSLRFPEMNQRRNGITDPKDASFERVFRSFERTAHPCISDALETHDQSNPDDEERENLSDQEYSDTSDATDSTPLQQVDQVWQDFVSWLRSDEPLFWVQGKPGSGKSTLLKHISTNDATRQLLHEWSPNARVITHYFYLIGTPLQSNMTGFYSSLSYQLLEGDEVLADEAILRYPLSTTKHHIGDWSVSELQELLDLILDIQVNHSSLCIFVDGLDECTDKGGQFALLERLHTIHRRPKIKMCVSSRPEPNLHHRLRSEPNFKLHDLTWPEMELYVYGQLRPFLEESAISKALFLEVKWKLLDKARGVFLWLMLALRSVTDGIHNDDSEQLLMLRLEELPSELEDLYEAMWKRVNKDTSVYRQTAARYLQTMLLFMEIDSIRSYDYKECSALKLSGITVFEMTCIKMGAEQKHVDPATERNVDQAIESYAKAEREIRVQCAGLLEIIPGDEAYDDKYLNGEACSIKDSLRTWTNSRAAQVRFIHRTAHDFLTTERGARSILGHRKIPSEDLLFLILRASLYLARLLHKELGLGFKLNYFLHSLSQVLEMCIQPMTDALHRLLDVAQSLYETDTLVAQNHRKTHFLSAAVKFRELDSWLLGQVGSLSADTATVVLGDIWPCPDDQSWYSGLGGSFIVRQLLSQGADPFAMRRYQGDAGSANGFNGIQAFISYFCLGYQYKGSKDASIFAEVIEAIFEAGLPFVDHCWLVFNLYGSPIPLQIGVLGHEQEFRWQGSRYQSYGPIYEVTTSVLLNYALRVAESMVPDIQQMMPRAREVLESGHSAMAARPRLRYAGCHLALDAVGHVFYDIVSQEPFEEAADTFFDFSTDRIMDKYNTSKSQGVVKKWHELIHSSREDPSILREIRFEDIASRYDMELSLGRRC